MCKTSDSIPRLGKRELMITRNSVVSVLISLWHSLGPPYNYLASV